MSLSCRRRIILDVVGKPAHEPHKVLDIPVVPFGENGPYDPLARLIDAIGHRFSLFGDDSLAKAAVYRVLLPADQSKPLHLRNLTADGGVVAPDAIGQFDDADGAEPFHQNQQGKQCAIERDARLLDHRFIALGPVHDADDFDQRAMEFA